MRVGVLTGGDSSERMVSLKSGNCIADAIESLGHEAVKIDPRHIDITLQGFFNLDKVFIALHGGMGESGHIQALLDLLKIPYTGSGLLASANSLNKLKTKEIWKSNALTSADWITVNKHTPTPEIKTSLSDLKYPVVVKPLNQGCSIGVSKADTADQLFDSLLGAFEYDDDILVESFITGREYTCAILNDEPLPVVQIRSEQFFDYDAKFGSQSATYHCPSDLTPEEEQHMQAIALKAYQALGCRGWGRVDTILSPSGEVFLIEMNTVPGMTTRSVFPMAAKEAGLSFEDTVEKLLASADYDNAS
ncbi:D-alanine--D-alanine ligase [Photobacterium sp. SDRW27]|uniref:D-alanine--D-alanine ligase n=1 Tax=Photobacterium obscurum TaxID=2829490 RepID=UPI0022433654|nr:D-alanine--D-alanine ligase [Photobacterium obscurum]MCW8328993.1 D-alanine--D-alanine ligase [Photobacterium obscurum]